MMYIHSLVRVVNNLVLDSPILLCYFIMYIFRFLGLVVMHDPLSCIAFNIIVLK